MKTRYILSSLSFGDFVIDLFFAKKVSNLKIIAADYLKPIAKAMDSMDLVEFIEVKHEIPPRLFSLKTSALHRVIFSFFRLFLSFKKIPVNKNLYVNANSIRWKLLFFYRKLSFLRNPKQNIYEAYCKMLNINFNSLILPIKKKKTIKIFPGSRQAKKNIPKSILQTYTNYLEERSVKYEIIYVKGKSENIENSKEIDGLGLLISEVKECDGIISADSLPIHIATYFNKDCFLISPEPSFPLMPIHILKNKLWSRGKINKNFVKWLSGEQF